MQLVRVRKIKSFLYEFDDQEDKEFHKKTLTQAAGLQIEKETDLTVEFIQVIYEKTIDKA
jgi:hypothetical protein